MGQIITGLKSQVKVAKPPSFDFRGVMIPQTVTVTAPAVAAAITLTVEALTQPIVASPEYPVFLTFTDPIIGIERLAEVTENADIGDVSLTINPLKRDITDNSAAVYPVILAARTSANFTPTLNNIDSITFENSGFGDGVVTNASYASSAPGNFLPLDAGLMTCMEAVKQFANVYLSIELMPPEGYLTGWQFKGIAGVTGLPIEIPADNIITATLEFTWRGEPIIQRPA